MSVNLVWAIIFAIFAIIFFVKIYLVGKNKRNDVVKVYFVLAIFSILMGFFLIDDYRTEKVESCIQAGYEIYVNGVPVDGTKLDLAHYKYSINEELEEMYLTTK